MVINWQTFTFTIKKENEDICYADNNMAWVLDGASGLYKEHISEHASDAAWFVYELDKYLKQHLLEEQSIIEILQTGLFEIKQQYLEFPGIESVQEYPSCAAAIIRRIGNVLEYYIMADCELMFKEIDGTIHRMSDHRVSVFDHLVLMEACRLSKERHTSVKDCLEDVFPMEIENRKLKNKANGYYALSDDVSICDKGITGRLSLDHIQSICLCSDGFAQYIDTMKIVDDEAAFFHELETKSFSQMHDCLYAKQCEDADLTKYPRFKLTDDNTVIYGEIKKDL